MTPEQGTKESFRAELERLVANFAANEDELTSPGYPEMQARTQFITPFFRALGWDVENRAAKPRREMEVWEEKGPGEGRPDYTFRIGGVAKFFVEAKAPHEDLESERHVMQVKRYAWSTKEVFAAILTDFQEFRFYDASQEPDPNHPHRGLIYDFTYKQYLGRIDDLWNLSRPRVAEGAIEALLPRDKLSLRFRKAPDDKFLEDMTRWREELARAIHRRNAGLSAQELTEIVQRLLDRLIFIRVAEDRLILPKRTLRDRAEEWLAVGGRKPLLPMLNELFHEINEDFNGEIFKYHPSEEINLDDDPTLHRIIMELYPPKSPYRFDAIPVDIFGAVYERYLGKTIYVKGKKVDVDDKPETRKAGGVYYTPKYIVDYIVQHTVGKLIEGKSPKEIEKIRILDPACGSGSFLLGAYQCLIDYHVDWYEQHPKEARAHPLYPELIRTSAEPPGTRLGEHRLSIHRKARILRNNLFGVDLDPQAVEITMMNLYLKALEGERNLPHKQHLLPELAANIKCGNSLIAPDIARELEPSPRTPSPVAPATGKRQPPSHLSPEDLARLRPFDWSAEFPDIMQRGGFDAVIGNPPYVRIQTLRDREPKAATYLTNTYASAKGGNFDIYVTFVERGATLLRQHGRFGFIVPNKFLRTDYGEGLRNFLLNNKLADRVVDFAHEQAFEGPTIYTCLLFLTKNSPSKLSYATASPSKDSLDSVSFADVPLKTLALGPWLLSSSRATDLLARLRSFPTLLSLPANISRGSSTGNDDVFIVEAGKQSGKYTTRDGEVISLESNILRIPIFATDFSRFVFRPAAKERIIFPYARHAGKFALISEKQLKGRFPRTFKYLAARRRQLEKRKQFAAWYSFSAPRNLELHDEATMIVPLLADRGLYAPCPGNTARYCPMASGGFTLALPDGSPYGWQFMLGLLNSRLLFWFLRNTSNIFRGGWITCTKQYVGKLPIPNRVRAKTASISRLVEERLGFAQSPSRGLPGEKVLKIEQNIDELVYDLYGLTRDEIALVEKSFPD